LLRAKNSQTDLTGMGKQRSRQYNSVLLSSSNLASEISDALPHNNRPLLIERYENLDLESGETALKRGGQT